MTNERQIAKLLASNFIERRDVKAIQMPNGDYFPHRIGPQKEWKERPLVPFDLASLVAHVDGTQTFGHYLVKPEGETARCFVFDIDFIKEDSPYHDPDLNLDATINPREVWSGPTTTCKKDLALQLTAMADGLAVRTHRLLSCKTMVAYSGNKGMHVIACFDPGTSASTVRAAAQTILETAGCFEPAKGNNFWKHSTGYPSLEIEVFPKQDAVKEGSYGNLVRLPLGINLKSGKPGWFLKVDADYGKFVKDDPMTVLEHGSVR